MSLNSNSTNRSPFAKCNENCDHVCVECDIQVFNSYCNRLKVMSDIGEIPFGWTVELELELELEFQLKFSAKV